MEASNSLLNKQVSNITCLPVRVGRDLNLPESSFSAMVAWRASGTSAGDSRQCLRGVWSRMSKGTFEATSVRAFGPEMVECPGLFFSRRSSGHVTCDGMGDREN